MPGSGYQDPTGITVDDGSMEQDSQMIGTEVDALSLDDVSIFDDSSVTVRTTAETAYKSAQTITEKLIAALTQEAQNIISVDKAYQDMDDDIKEQLQALSD